MPTLPMPAPAAVPAIEVHALDKHFGRHAALQAVDLRVRPGEMVALLGASGSGNSTLHRQLAGLHRADAGSTSRIEIHGQPVQAGGQLSPDARHVRTQVAMIFQQFNLVPRLPVLV